MRAQMPEQHRELFGRLPFMLLAALDEHRRPWATVLAGPPGFVRTPDPSTLALAARPLGEPAFPRLKLQAGSAVGLLGIEPATRRRNRINGVVSSSDSTGLVVDVRQSFGNCPKYIQARSFFAVDTKASAPRRFEGRLDPASLTQVISADTFFIATASPDAGLASQAPSGGVDVSHRGGAPGFVRVTEEEGRSVLAVPDFVGNFFFNTLGNIAAKPHAGLLFIDWQSGDMVALSCDAEIAWEGPLVAAHPGAQRVLLLRVVQGLRLPSSMPLRASGVDYAPQLAALGAWAA